MRLVSVSYLTLGMNTNECFSQNFKLLKFVCRETWQRPDVPTCQNVDLYDHMCECLCQSYLLHRCVFHSVCVVMVVDDFKVLDSLSFGWAAEVAVQVCLSCSFSAHSEMSGLV